MNPAQSSQDPMEEVVGALLDGDLDRALERLRTACDAATSSDRLRYGLAISRLLVAVNRVDEARQALNDLEADLRDAGVLDTASTSQLALEKVVIAARTGDVAQAKAHLASVPQDHAAIPEASAARAVQALAGLAALRGTDVLEDTGKLLEVVQPVNRVALEANLLLARGDAERARAMLAREVKRFDGNTSLETQAGLFVQLAVLLILSGHYKQAIRHLKDARARAVEAGEPALYLSAAALLVVAYVSLEDKVNAFAVAMRAMVSLEDLLGRGGGSLFQSFLGSFREAWGENTYRQVALRYVALRKRGAIM